MLTKRIIPCLDVSDGRVVKGLNFESLRDAGDPVELAKKYSDDGADELVFLDITASEQGRETLKDLVRNIAKVNRHTIYRGWRSWRGTTRAIYFSQELIKWE